MGDKITRGKHGGDRKSQEWLSTKSNNVTLDNKQGIRGNAITYALRRLQKLRPDLHQQVIDKKLSAHKAMVRAGFRKQTVTITKDIESMARFISKNFTMEEVKEIVQLAFMLQGDPDLLKKDMRYEDLLVSYEFKESIERVMGAIQNARESNWTTTSREGAYREIKSLLGILAIGK